MTLEEVAKRLERIERLLATLVSALAEDEEPAGTDLDGNPIPSERDQTQSL